MDGFRRSAAVGARASGTRTGTTCRSRLACWPATHLRGEAHIGLYLLLDGDRCWWLPADWDGPDALPDALMYVKAAVRCKSRSPWRCLDQESAHAWMFFTSPVPAEMARRLGTSLLREAMAMRGRMNLASSIRSRDSRRAPAIHRSAIAFARRGVLMIRDSAWA